MCDREAFCSTEDEKTGRLAGKLNRILRAFTEEDVLGMKRYKFSKHFLHSIRVWHHDDDGRIYYKSTGTMDDLYTKFHVPDDNQPLKFDDSYSKLSLDNMPKHIWDKILDQVVSTPKGVVYDLDSHKAYGLTPHALRLGLLFEGACNVPERIARRNAITIRAASVDSVTNFNGFAALEDLVSEQ